MPFVQRHRMRFPIPLACSPGAAQLSGKAALRAGAVAIKQLLFQPEHKEEGVQRVTGCSQRVHLEASLQHT